MRSSIATHSLELAIVIKMLSATNVTVVRSITMDSIQAWVVNLVTVASLPIAHSAMIIMVTVDVSLALQDVSVIAARLDFGIIHRRVVYRVNVTLTTPVDWVVTLKMDSE